MQSLLTKNSALVHDAQKRKWIFFREPSIIFTSCKTKDIPPILSEIEKKSAAKNLYALGFLSYEASSAFDKSFPDPKNSAPAFPLLYFAMYPEENLEECDESIFEEGLVEARKGPPLQWEPLISQKEYKSAFKKIKDYIGRGHSYQVNYSFRLESLLDAKPSLRANAWSLFQQMIYAQTWPSYQKSYGAYIECEDWIICSASPELFFSLEGNRLCSRPMKGTIARGLYPEQDHFQEKLLKDSPKDRAENSMIVDMARNDMGRIASLGKVHLAKAFQTRAYPSLWQMTSEVHAHSKAGLFEIFSALFPPASITGAPKKRTIEIIHELEKEMRDMYTGSIGFWGPGRRAQFNVAIRTAWIHKESRKARYGIGSGIIWDSIEEQEWKECQIKSAILKPLHTKQNFSLLESILWEAKSDSHDGEYFLLEEHLKRLTQSAKYFDFLIDLKNIHEELEKEKGKMQAQAHKVRLLLSSRGQITLESTPLLLSQRGELENPKRNGKGYSVCLAKKAVDSTDPFLYHKTNQRAVYEQAKEDCPAHCEDVLLWNARGELTESTIANVLVQINGELFTPPLTCGLLGGIYRSWLLEQKKIKEAVILTKDLKHCEKMYLINSVRKQWEVELFFYT